MTSKNVAAKTVKKVPAPKPAKVAKPRGNVVVAEAKVRFVSFTFGATIPTQAFGNVQPQIVVEAPSYEEAAAFAIPKIEELYAKYAEVKPTYLSKITETVKTVAPVPVAPVAAPEATAPAAPAVEAPVAPQTPKPESVLKAEKAISLAATADAALAIQTQIENSVKIPAEFKPALITLVLQKRSSFK